jgi:hypothetical protein
VREASARDMVRPPPCAHEQKANSLPRPSITYDDVPIEPGTNPVAPRPTPYRTLSVHEQGFAKMLLAIHVVEPVQDRHIAMNRVFVCASIRTAAFHARGAVLDQVVSTQGRKLALAQAQSVRAPVT